MSVSKKGVSRLPVAPVRNLEPKAGKPKVVAPATGNSGNTLPPKKAEAGSAYDSVFTFSAPQPIDKAGKTMMQNFEEINTMMKTQFNSAIQSMNILAKSMEEVSKAVFQFYQNSFENNLAACKSLMACKNAQEAFDIQSNLAKTNLDSFISEGSKISQMSYEAANRAFQPIQNSFSQAVDNATRKAA